MIDDENLRPSNAPVQERPDLNEETLNHLIRELNRAEDAETAANGPPNEIVRGSPRWQDKLNPVTSKMGTGTEKYIPSTKWSPLEIVALRRAAMAIIDFDGIGRGVFEKEARGIASRTRSKIISCGRHLVRRYDKERGGLDPLVAAVAAEVFDHSIFPEND